MSEEIMNILKTGVCQSLSGRSTLTYEIVSNSNESILLRIISNTGTGIFSKEWIPLSLVTPTEDATLISAKMLKVMFKGKSVNTVGFIVASLIAEGLLKVSQESLRSYERVSEAEYKKILHSYLEPEQSLQKKSRKAKTYEGA